MIAVRELLEQRKRLFHRMEDACSCDKRKAVLMRVLQQYYLPVGIMVLFLLAGCGNNAGGGTGTTPTQPPTTPVTLQVGSARYQPGSTISVTIKNQSNQTVYFSDHKTNCTVLLLERQTANTWTPVAPCRLMIATRIHSLQAGDTLEVKLPTTSQWPTGSYHARLDYSDKAAIGNAAPTAVYSSTFLLG